jgi:hypothetical protein
MDQLKVALQAVKKHHFWILCGVIVLVVLGAWWSSTSGLAGMYEERKTALEGKMSNVSNVASQSLHPNPAVITGIGDAQAETTKSVFEAWQFLYRDQEQYMKWPELLGADFTQYMQFLPPNAPIPLHFRDRYMNFIQQHFPALIEIVDMRLPVLVDERGNPILDEEGNKQKTNPFEKMRMTQGYSDMEEGMGSAMDMMYERGTAGGMGPSGPGEMIGVVDWNRADLQRIRNSLFWANTPETIQVRLAQQDLWVYEALLRIIAATNGQVKSYYKAPVKEIRALEIGQQAAVAFAAAQGMSMRGMGPGYGGGMMSEEYEESMMSDVDEEYGDEGGGTMYSDSGSTAAPTSPEEILKSKLLENRYVDKDLKPLPAAEATAAENEFKMMPVRLLLVVDQRRITKLLVECANSAMPVVVTKIALSPGSGTLDIGRMGGGMMTGYEEEGETDMMYGGGMMSGGMMSGGMDSMMYEEEGPSSGMMSGTGGTSGRGQQDSYDVPIEIQGVIYIFNRPDKEKLGAASGAPAAAPTDNTSTASTSGETASP